VIFMDAGDILCEEHPDVFFDAPPHERLKTFLRQVLK